MRSFRSESGQKQTKDNGTIIGIHQGFCKSLLVSCARRECTLRNTINRRSRGKSRLSGQNDEMHEAGRTVDHEGEAQVVCHSGGSWDDGGGGKGEVDGSDRGEVELARQDMSRKATAVSTCLKCLVGRPASFAKDVLVSGNSWHPRCSEMHHTRLHTMPKATTGLTRSGPKSHLTKESHDRRGTCKMFRHLWRESTTLRR